jgi:hypothetical protein
MRPVRRNLWMISIAACVVVGLLRAVAAEQRASGAGQPAAAPPGGSAPGEPWPTWGGPRRDFTVAATGLADAWPAGGPPRLWSRALGDGYSGIAEEHGTLYTAYRQGGDDVVIALDAQSGKTIWETRYAAPFKNANASDVGPGPYAMPQVIGERVVMVSGHGQIQSLDKQSGKIVWSHDLYGEYGGTRLQFGYSSHPLPYKDTLIVLAGGGGLLARLTGYGASGAIAFRQRDGHRAAGAGNDRIQSGGWGAAVAAPASDAVRAGGQHAGLGTGQHPRRFISIRRRKPRAGAAPGQRPDDGA